jgi:SAM-dependent methyltransferase
VSDDVKPGKVVWSKGDFGRVAPLVEEVGEVVVDASEVQADEAFLDVACGTGNVALPAAERGAEVTGLDIVPDLLEQGKQLAAGRGVEVTWVEGDAGEMPFEDESFDVVASAFGCMFVPDHRTAATEIGRLVNPGGRISIAAWIPEGTIGEFFALIGSHMPPPPDGFQPPPKWGLEDHVREIFEGTGIELDFERRDIEQATDSAQDMFDRFTVHFGPLVHARDVLEPEDKWQALADDILAYSERVMTPTDDGRVSFKSNYLLTTGTKAS